MQNERFPVCARLLATASLVLPAACTPPSTTAPPTRPLARPVAHDVAVAPEPRVTAPVHPDDRSVDPAFREEAWCVLVRDALRCAEDRVVRIAYFSNAMTGPTHCQAWCADAAGQRDGEFRQALIGITRAGELVAGRYDHGVPVGIWRTEVDAGCRFARGPARDACEPPQRLAEESYDARGLLDGERRAWGADGRLRLREHFSHGLRSGAYETWHPNGQRARSGQLAVLPPPSWDPELGLAPIQRAAPAVNIWPPAGVRSVAVGSWQSWDETGRLVATERYDDAGQPIGDFCHWNDRRAQMECEPLKQGTGTLTRLDADGRPAAKYRFAGGKLSGTSEWFQHGRRVGRQTFAKGKAQGLHEEWDDEGHLVLRETYRNDLLHGPYLEQQWEENGRREITRGRYCNDQKCGLWVRTMPPTRLRAERTYDVHGDQIAERSWDEDGQPIDAWSLAEQRAADHRACLAELAKGGCCDPEQRPPPGAKLCENGDPGR